MGYLPLNDGFSSDSLGTSRTVHGTLMSISKNKSVEIELSKSGQNLYIFFGGIAAGIGMPIFEFYNYSKIMDENKIFVRDFSQCWYQDGLQEVSKDINSTAKFLKNKIEAISPEKIFFVGNSMGGYAAILFAHLIGKGEVVAFSPQTFISPLLRFKYNDYRWMKQVYCTYRKSLFKRKEWNLKPFLLRSNRNIKTSIFVSTESQLDHVHALHLKDIPCVNIYEFEQGGHGVVKSLRDNGDLHAIMTGTYANM